MSEVIEKVREKIAKLEYRKDCDLFGEEDKWEDTPDEMKEIYLKEADEILAIPEIAVVDSDPELPDNVAWHMKEREFEAYCAGQNDMLIAGYRQEVKEESEVNIEPTVPASNFVGTLPGECFLSSLAANVGNGKLSDAEFRQFVKRTLPIVIFNRVM